MVTMTKQIQSLFNQIATTYDEHAIVERETADRLLDDLQYIKINPKVILDLGCGTGYAIPLLTQRFPEATIIGLDCAINMFKINKPWIPAFAGMTASRNDGDAAKLLAMTGNTNLVCGDIFQAPFKRHSFDMIFSNHAIHLCDNPNELLKQIRLLLKPHGLFLFSALGPSTLLELDQPDPPYLDMHDWVNLLGKNGFAHPLLHRDTLVLEYDDLQTLITELKASGKKVPDISPTQWECWAEQHRQNNGTLPARFELITGHAWGFAL